MKRFCLLLLCCVTFSCTTENTDRQKAADQADEIVPLPEDFLEFYDRFHEDSVYQMNHIAFPLPGKPASGDFDIEITEMHWQKDGWKIHKPFDENDDTFDQQFVLYDDKLITEFIYSPTYGYYMERRWAKLSDGWNLIYFADLQQPESE